MIVNSTITDLALWKYRYAKNRLEKLEQSEKLKTEILFYGDMIGHDKWKQAKLHF